jgi:hypothetical protein
MPPTRRSSYERCRRQDVLNTLDVMAATYEEVPFSELLHHPAATAARLNTVRVLRLRRRDAEDLALVRVDQMERDGAVVDFMASLLVSLVRTDNTDVLRRALPDAVPWLTFIPEPDVEKFLAELVSVVRGAVALDNLTPIALLLNRWRNAAELYADPTLSDLGTREPGGRTAG